MFSRVIRLAVDMLIAACALLLGYWLAVGAVVGTNVSYSSSFRLEQIALTYAVLAGAVGYVQRTYRCSWSFASVRDILHLARTATITAGLFLGLAFIFNRADGYPRSTFVLAWWLHICGLAGIRLAARALREKTLVEGLLPFLQRRAHRFPGVPLLLIGTPGDGEAFVRELERTGDNSYQPAGIVAPDGRLSGSEVRNVAVLGSYADIWRILQDVARTTGRAKPALLFLDTQHHRLDAEVIARLKREGFQLLRRPRLGELTDSDEKPFRELSFEDLLFRQPVHLDGARASSYLAGKRVLVTGAGGSIGSELCRQIAGMGAAHLCLLDSSEFNLFEIDREIANTHPAISRATALCTVREQPTVEFWIRSQAPDVIFHAAALKHVPMVEDHPAEGVLTNVIGTANVALAAQRLGVPHMVMISTDKAVSPSNVMGATKRLAEDFVRGLGRDARDRATRFHVVRFGNVLGSAGSVVPIFRDQIERGGPVTVTHEDVERFFMTIPEAVQLVLHASAVGADSADPEGGVYVLDMGTPVKILDLARQVIQLHGFDPDVDMPIEIVGLRPGEKLTEELVDTNELVLETGEGIMKVGFRGTPHLPTLSQLRELEIIARQRDKAALRREIQAILKTCAFHVVAA